MKSAPTVFVCSTFSDLGAEREGVMDAIRQVQLQHEAAEFFGARADQPIETCLEEVRSSTLIVVIVGHLYGTVVPDFGVSFSEAEYNEAYKLGKPCLVYLRDVNFPVLPKYIDRDPQKLELLDNWKSTLHERHTVAYFQESSDLAVKVAADLGRAIRELEETSRARAEAREAPSVPFLEEVTELLDDAAQQGASDRALLSAIRRSISEVVREQQKLGSSVFLSYARDDSMIVGQVAEALIARGLRVWFDQNSLKPGAEILQEIERELDSADFIIFFISPASVDSKWVQLELQIALHRQVLGEQGAVVIPVLLEPADVPPLLRSIQWLDLTNGDVSLAVEQLVETMHHYDDRFRAPLVVEQKGQQKKFAPSKIISILEEERGNVGSAAKRLGLSSKRLYQLLKHHNIQARQYR